MPLEKTVVAAITKYLTKEGFFVWKQHGGPFQMAGLPDLMAVKDGQFYGFEVKAPGSKPRKGEQLQRTRLRQLADHGAVTATVKSVDDVKSVLFAYHLKRTLEGKSDG